MNKNAITIAVLALLVIGGYVGYQGLISKNPASVSSVNEAVNQNTPVEQAPENNIPQENPGEPNTPTEENDTKTHEVTYTDAGYAPTELKIKVGDTVVFRNESSKEMWTASAMHPSHTVYSDTALQQHCPDAENDDFDQCQDSQPGESWSFTFTKAGTWGYHNHSNSRHFGKIIVE